MALLTAAVGYLASKGAKAAKKKLLGGKSRRTPSIHPYEAAIMGQRQNVVAGGPFKTGVDIDIMGEREFEKETGYEFDPKKGEYVKKRRRRRRRALLTQSDKADIAFLVGTLGKGQMGAAAVSTLLSRRC